MVSAVKVFKKTAPNGKITVYLGRRDFVDNTETTEPVDGVVLVEEDYLRGRKVYATVGVTYRFQREEDEVMGVQFSKDMVLAAEQIYPSTAPINPTETQDRLMRKLGGGARPFMVALPAVAPASVVLQDRESSKPLGVLYELRVFVADHPEEKLHKRNTVALAVRKVQFAPLERSGRMPSTLVSKGFALSSGKLNLELTVEREMYYHGEQVVANMSIMNGSRKTVKEMKCSIVQHIEITMTNNHFTRTVASVESKDGCPVGPGSQLKKSFVMNPVATTCKKNGLALDGQQKDSDVHLASSTIMSNGQSAKDALGIVVSYSVRTFLNCGAMGGQLVADLPIKIVHPSPSAVFSAKRGSKADEIVFEDFAKIRRGMSVDMQ